jgi:hypothetical protein
MLAWGAFVGQTIEPHCPQGLSQKRWVWPASLERPEHQVQALFLSNTLG